MKLTTEQINQIDTFLERNDVKYLDIKLELLDHIASQIEALISEQNSSFEEAFIIIKDNWKPRLLSSSSFLIGIIYSFPKIVLDRLLARMKKYNLFILCLSIFIYIPMFYYKSHIHAFLAPFDEFVNIIAIVSCSIICLVVIRINFHSIPTSYRFLVNQSAPIIILSFFILLFDHEVIELKIFYTLLMLFQAIVAFQNYRLHIGFVKKLTKA
nr:hypothetical protein [uncultured Flavobacterium sp.]